MNNSPHASRRQFLQAGVAALSISSLPAAVRGTVAPSDKINIGVIGLGSRGFNLLDAFLAESDCRIVAVCDVDDLHYRDRPWGTGRAYGRKAAASYVDRTYTTGKSGRPGGGVTVYSDFRELVAHDGIDAVVVATPDHWHAQCTLTALKAGRDVYCEKPVTHLFGEGQAVVSEVAEQRAVFQTGSQQRSDPLFQKVVEISRNGLLGQIQRIEVGLPKGYSKAMGKTEIVTPRTGLDYDFWCGPSEVLPLMQARFHRWWRGHSAYGGGVLMDWIGHHNDIAHWAINQHRGGPLSVEAVNWEFPGTDVYDTPANYTIECSYPKGITSTISSEHTQGVKIIGSDGWVYARRGKIEASDARWLEKGFQPGTVRIQTPRNHAADFLDKVRSRGECIAPAEIAHRSITPGHLGYVSQALGKKLEWDSASETVTNSEEADRLLKQVAYRSKWDLPV